MKVIFFLLVMSITSLAKADGLVVVVSPVPDHWRVSQIGFYMASGPILKPSALLSIEYLFPDGSLDHADQLVITGVDRTSLLGATQTSSGSDEASLKLPDNVTPDLDAILILRISRWLIGHGKLSGVTAVPTSINSQ